MNSAIVTESSRTLIVATAGHVDHGKTALVQHLTGKNTDTLAEEKSRGLTINLGYAYHHFLDPKEPSSSNTIGFVDVPGHTDFINNMLAGVGGVDAALLIIAADDGVMPQTREHLAVLDLLGISTGLVALTKIDRCEPARVEQVSRDIKSLLKPTTLAQAPIFPVSNISRSGIDALRSCLEKLPTLLNHNGPSSTDRRARYLIDRSFNVKGIGTVVTGSVRTGILQTGDSLLCTQTDEMARIKSLRLDMIDVPSAVAGQRIAANINLDRDRIERGHWLIDPRLNHKSSRLDVKLRILDGTPKPKSGASYHLHIGASHQVITIHPLDEEANLYQLKLKTPIVCSYGDRFIIRDSASSHTVGGGKILDIYGPRRQRSSEQRLCFLQAADQDDEQALTDLINSQKAGVDFDQFEIGRNLSAQRSSQLLEQTGENCIALSAEGHLHPLLLGKDFYQDYIAKIQKAVKEFHSSQPSQQGISESALGNASSLPVSYKLFQSVLNSLLEKNQLKRTGTLIHAPEHSTALSREEEEFIARIRPILLQSGTIPPRTRELAELTGIPLRAIERILNQTTKAGSLVRVAENRHYLPETILELANFTETLMEDSGNEQGFSVIQFRDKSNIGRNLCIEILEYFDNVGFTRREGNSRFVRTAKENIFNRA